MKKQIFHAAYNNVQNKPMNFHLRRSLQLLHRIRNRTIGANQNFFKPYQSLFENKTGLEIGGPSRIFNRKDHLPVYKYAKKIDGINFSGKTIWEGTISEGLNYQYAPGKIGYQFICEGNELAGINDNTYDFVLSSHNLEHFANPLKAVAEWKRVLRKQGVMLLILPDKRFTFDHRRAVTLLGHLIDDYETNVGEDDLTHVQEILNLHDISRDPGARNFIHFKDRSLKNYENRCLHQHVFDERLLKEIFLYFGINLLVSSFIQPYNIIVLGQNI